MAKVTNHRMEAELKKETAKVASLRRKMELQQKEEELGDSWKMNLRGTRLKEIEAAIGDLGAPKLKDAIDINEFFEDIKMYKSFDNPDQNVKFDFEKYTNSRQYVEDAIKDCDDGIYGTGEEGQSLTDSLTALREKTLSKEQAKRLVPEYIKRLYEKWAVGFNRFVPVYDKYVCTCCGRPLPIDEYYLVYNEVDLARMERTGKMHTHICKDCCKKLFEHLYFERAEKDVEKAMQYFCSYLNIYYDETTFLSTQKQRNEEMENESEEEKTSGKSKKNGLNLVDMYMGALAKSATLKGKTFIESLSLKRATLKDGKDKEIIESKDGSVPDDIEEGWSEADMNAKRLVNKMVGYDPFFYETEDARKTLYKDLLNMLEAGEMDGLRIQAAVQIVLAFARIREYNATERKLIDSNAPMAELKNLADLKNKQLTTITNFSRDNGFGERYAIAKQKGENTFTGIMSKMSELKYEDAIVNMYDALTSSSIEQAANASIKAISEQLNFSEAEIYKTCQEQLHRINELQRENLTLQENLRLAKRDLAEERLRQLQEKSEKDSSAGWTGF